jgi:predicted transcriptional regulator
MSGLTDVMLNVVRPDNQDYQGLSVSSEVATKLGMKSFVVLNKVHRKLRKPKLSQTITKAFHLPVAGMLPLSDDIILSQSQFVFTHKYPEHEFSRAIYGVAESVFGIKPKSHLELMHGMLVDIKQGKIKFDEMWRKEQISKSGYARYLDDLLKEGFIKKQKEKFFITSKGEKFLKKYKTIRKFVDDFRL